MKRLIIIVCIVFSSLIHSQDFNPKMINLSQNPEIKDFSFLKEELKDVQVVMLGENTHFDGNVFEMKTKIVQYLHKEMGFNTIAFESGIYDVWKAQKNIENGQNVKESLSNSLFSIWAKRNEFQSFIEFYDQNKKKLNLFGFDYQITGKNGTTNLSKDIFDYAKSINHKLKLNPDDFELLLESITNSGMFDEEDITYIQFKTALTELETKVSQQKDSDEKFYWNQIIKSLLELSKDAIAKEEILSTFNTSSVDNIRDKQMADNLLAYLRQNPNAKIICWGANAHFVNKMNSISEPILKEFVPMGSYLKHELDDKVYSLVAITATDSIFLQNKWHLTPIHSNSFEFFLKKQQSPHIFISSNQSEMNQSIQNRLFSPITFVNARIDELHDGYLFFDKVISSTIIENEEDTNVYHQQKEIATENDESKFVLHDNTTVLDDIVVSVKMSPYHIMKKVINSLEKNYPDTSFNSFLKSNVKSTIADTTCLDLDFVLEQYDLGYVNHTNRSTKKIKEVRWNVKKDFLSESLREYHGLIYNSPIQYAPFLKKGKYRKFIFVLEETIFHNGEEVYVIGFSSPRNHSTFTRRVFLSNYSGYLYVNKKDYAVVKIFENWEVIDFPEAFKEGYNLKGTLLKFTSKEYINETTVTDFSKIDGMYFITHSTNTITGNVITNKSEKEKFTITINSYWDNFNIKNPNPIKNKDEEHLFGNIKYNVDFWNSFKF
jgi:erythromycin esterase-like protein